MHQIRLVVWSPCVSWPPYLVTFSFKNFYDDSPNCSCSAATQHKCHKPLYPPEMLVHAWVCVCACTLTPWWTLSYLYISSPLCPHVFEFHYYLTAANKQFAPLNGSNALHPDTRLSNRREFLCLSSSSYGKESTWRSSTDNTEAHYLLRALQGSTETWKVQQYPSCWPGMKY